MNLIQAESFPRLVPLRDPVGNFYESESTSPPAFQSAVREITETAYWKILAAADVTAIAISMLPSTEAIAAQPYAPDIAAAPLDDLRRITAIPPGAGYKPKGDNRINVYESAALQERAREDHQRVLGLIQHAVSRRGGVAWYNNNIDLYARVGEQHLLIEAKSLSNVRAAVDRMRYGIGQLADYDFRYREQLKAPRKVLAFGARPPREAAWISNVLQDQRIAFVAASGETLLPLNEAAESLPLF